MSLHDSGVIFSVPWMGFQLSGMKYRHGNKSRVFAPYNMYRASDGYVMIAINEDSRWKAFLRSIGREALVDDPRFQSVADRVRNYDDIDAIISSVVRASRREGGDGRGHRRGRRLGPCEDDRRGPAASLTRSAGRCSSRWSTRRSAG